MSLTARTRTRIRIATHNGLPPLEGTITGLLCHWRRANPAKVTALELAMIHAGHIPDSADFRQMSLEANLHHLTTADLERLETSARHPLPPAEIRRGDHLPTPRTHRGTQLLEPEQPAAHLRDTSPTARAR